MASRVLYSAKLLELSQHSPSRPSYAVTCSRSGRPAAGGGIRSTPLVMKRDAFLFTRQIATLKHLTLPDTLSWWFGVILDIIHVEHVAVLPFRWFPSRGGLWQVWLVLCGGEFPTEWDREEGPHRGCRTSAKPRMPDSPCSLIPHLPGMPQSQMHRKGRRQRTGTLWKTCLSGIGFFNCLCWVQPSGRPLRFESSFFNWVNH